MAHSGNDEFEICETWAQAESLSKGYDDERLMQELSRLPSGRVDSQLSDHLGVRYVELLAAIATAVLNQGPTHLRVLDVGGGDANMFKAIEHIIGGWISEWVVLETPACAARFECGDRDPRLRWTAALDSVESDTWDVVLISGALQYLPDPAQSLRRFAETSNNVIVMRTPLHDGAEHVPAVQRPRGSGYVEADSSMPVWFLSRDRLLSSVQDKATIVYQWETQSEAWSFSGRILNLSGFVLRAKGDLASG